MNVVLLDNFDSFTYNLVDQVRALGHAVRIFRNDVAVQELHGAVLERPDTALLLSPGPGQPAAAGNMMALVERCVGQVPVLGVCLGHQALCQHYGARIVRAAEVVHGKVSYVRHGGAAMFAGLPDPLPVGRYHSLVAEGVPAPLEVVARLDGMPMAVVDAARRVAGFQFHPESILTADGARLLEQTLRWAGDGSA